VLLPPELRDYIILHELAHLEQMNHSRAFWDLLEQLDPKARQHDKAITQKWSHLMRLGRV